MALVFAGVIILLVLGAVGVFFRFYEARTNAARANAVLDGLASAGQAPVYSSTENLYAGWFSETFETVVFMFRDGTKRSFTSREAGRIDMPAATYGEQFRREGRRVSDIELCIHNHFTPIGFTEGDKLVWRHLKGEGFKGTFRIYYTATGEVKDMKEN